MLGTIIGLIVIGIIAGYIARLVVPGRSGLGIGGTLLLGIVGSFVGGFLGYLLFGRNSGGDGFIQPSSWIGSIIGAIIVLAIYQATRGRNRTRA
ncbi:GlsB/YeaQ/YmgE family stress response membrane protein [Quadrisphaera sp. KR29]|uniref:GlsB/YeaQ/YmgE family stress response membrane protein n=1 Tax=Quadrisphaera sp. KR29 TaxID=3461391 RepID=UPI004043BCE6